MIAGYIGPQLEALYGSLYGYFEPLDLSPLEDIDITVYFNGATITQEIDSYININQALDLNITYGDRTPFNPIGVLKKGTTTQNLSIVSDTINIPIDTLNESGIWTLYVYDTTRKTASQNFLIRVSDLP